MYVYVYLYVRLYVCMCVCTYVCMYVYMYVCMYVCTYVCPFHPESYLIFRNLLSFARSYLLTSNSISFDLVSQNFNGHRMALTRELMTQPYRFSKTSHVNIHSRRDVCTYQQSTNATLTCFENIFLDLKVDKCTTPVLRIRICINSLYFIGLCFTSK